MSFFVDYTGWGKHLKIQLAIESLCCIYEANIMYANYTSIKYNGNINKQINNKTEEF